MCRDKVSTELNPQNLFLDQNHKVDTFDIVVIGMQEAAMTSQQAIVDLLRKSLEVHADPSK